MKKIGMGEFNKISYSDALYNCKLNHPFQSMEKVGHTWHLTIVNFSFGKYELYVWNLKEKKNSKYYWDMN